MDMTHPRLFHLLHRARKAVFARADREVSEAAGVTVAELVTLWRLPAAPTIGALATALEVDQAAASRLVAQLERKGMVARTADPTDGRRRRVQRTPAGEASARRGVALVAEANALLTAGFSDAELAVVARFLEHATRLGGDR